MNINGSGLTLLLWTFTCYASHLNLAGMIVVGLDSRMEQIPEWLKHADM